jgi:hypothetical protein
MYWNKRLFFYRAYMIKGYINLAIVVAHTDEYKCTGTNAYFLQSLYMIKGYINLAIVVAHTDEYKCFNIF